MATFSAAAVRIPSFTSRKVSVPHTLSVSASGAVGVRAWVKEKEVEKKVLKMGAAVVAASVIVMGASANANAMEVLMGGNGGELAFFPNEFQVASGEAIVFKNNAGFPHNVIFDEDEVPEGVDVSTISMSEEDLLNAPGQTYKVTLAKKGTYKFYCAPHQGIGMAGKVTVN